MEEFKVDFEWEDPQGSAGAELRATWSRLSVSVAGTPVTRSFNASTKILRDSIYLPLYPVAEWLASNWWFLKSESAGARLSPGFDWRHNLRHGREGFALPDLEITPTGELTHLEWSVTAAKDWPIRFLEQGSAYVATEQFLTEVERTINATLERLLEQGLEDSALKREWDLVSNATPEEASFCEASAALGADPYSLDEQTERMILQAHEVMNAHPEAEREFFQAAELSRLQEHLTRLQNAHKALVDARPGRVKALNSFTLDRVSPPWSQGYELARVARKQLGIEDHRFTGPLELLDIISDQGRIPTIDLASEGLFDAVMLTRTDSHELSLVLDSEKSRNETRSFGIARAFGEYLASSGRSNLQLLTDSQTERQKRSRAFAAEFLAPSELLRGCLGSSRVTDDDVLRVAAEFSVSPLVIFHQIENHRLMKGIVH